MITLKEAMKATPKVGGAAASGGLSVGKLPTLKGFTAKIPKGGLQDPTLRNGRTVQSAARRSKSRVR